MKKFIPWRKASTILIVLVILFISPHVFQHITEWWGPIALATKTRPLPQDIVTSSDERKANDSLNYGVVVDCGSSGSRVFVYHWQPHSGHPDHLLDIKILRNFTDRPVAFKIKPGLSSLHKQPSQASNYLSPLLEFAAGNIPHHKIKETPLYIFATAGLRLLPSDEQEALLNDLRTDVGLDYDFIFYDSHVEVISGEDEAIYAWTAINQALGKFSHELNDDPLIPVEVSGKIHVRKKTVGMLDLGGASLQVALELPQTYSVYDPRVKRNLFEFNLGCSTNEFSHKYKLYAKTFLGHGSDRTRSEYVEWLVRSRTNNSSASSSSSSSTKAGDVVRIGDPCLPLGSPERSVSNGVTFQLTGSGELEECRQLLRQFLKKSVDCVLSNRRRCSIDGAILPDMNFRNVEFYGFSEFYYTMQDLLEIGGAYSFHYFKDKAQDYCATDWSIIESWKNSSRFPRADAQRYRLQCFKSAWILEVLHEGLNFPTSYRHLTSIQYLDGYEIHWSLGAIIHKTKYFPLRDIEKLSTSRSKTSIRFSHLLTTPPWSIAIWVLLLVAFVSSMLCMHLIHPANRKRQRCASTCTETDFEERFDDNKSAIIRSRSYGAFV